MRLRQQLPIIVEGQPGEGLFIAKPVGIHEFFFLQSHVQSTHGLQGTYRTAVTKSQFSNLTFLAEVTVDTMLFNRDSKHL